MSSSPWSLIVAGTLVLAALVVALEVVPRASEAVGAFAEWRALEARRAAPEEAAAERARLRAEERVLRARLEAVLAEPGAAGIGAVVARLEGLAAESGAEVLRVEPEPSGGPSGAGRPGTGPSGTGPSDGAAGRYRLLPIALDVRGPFHALGRLTHAVETDPLLMRLLALEAARPQRGAQRGTSQDGGLTATLLIEVLQPE